MDSSEKLLVSRLEDDEESRPLSGPINLPLVLGAAAQQQDDPAPPPLYCYTGTIQTSCDRSGCSPHLEDFSPLVFKNDKDREEE